MSLTAPEFRSMARGETNTIDIDWGENTAGSETGVLKAGDTVASCAVSLDDSPSGSTTPTIGSVTVNATALYVNGRECSAGEATICTVTTGATQGYGAYRLKFTATTTNSKVIPRYVVINVDQPR